MELVRPPVKSLVSIQVDCYAIVASTMGMLAFGTIQLLLDFASKQSNALAILTGWDWHSLLQRNLTGTDFRFPSLSSETSGPKDIT